MKNRLIALCAAVIFGVFVSSCDNGSTGGVKTTLKIASGAPSKSVLQAAAPAKVELYIFEFVIDEDANARGLWMVGDFHAGSKGGRHKNRGWFDVTSPKTLAIVNDTNPGKYSMMTLNIEGLRVNGVELLYGQGTCCLFYKDPGFTIPDHNHHNAAHSQNFPNAEEIPWTPITLTPNSNEVIVSLSMDTDIFESDGTTIKSKWWENIKIDVEVKEFSFF